MEEIGRFGDLRDLKEINWDAGVMKIGRRNCIVIYLLYSLF